MVSLNVNRMARRFHGDPELPLLWNLRDELRQCGTYQRIRAAIKAAAEGRA